MSPVIPLDVALEDELPGIVERTEALSGRRFFLVLVARDEETGRLTLLAGGNTAITTPDLLRFLEDVTDTVRHEQAAATTSTVVPLGKKGRH